MNQKPYDILSVLIFEDEILHIMYNVFTHLLVYFYYSVFLFHQIFRY